MKASSNFKIILSLLLILVVGSLVVKFWSLSDRLGGFYPEERYTVNYQYFFKTKDKPVKIKSFLPKNSSRQQISLEKTLANSTVSFNKLEENNNVKGIWTANKTNHYEKIEYTFEFEGKSKSYTVPDTFEAYSTIDKKYLMATENIQVYHPKIAALSTKLSKDKTTDKAIITALHNYVKNIPNEPILTLTDAVSALEQNMASCNGKSRLLVALSRQLGYPARIKGGIILNTNNTRTSHSWAELYINKQWVPFDPVNDNFAHIPANYLELYEDDAFLLTHTAGVNFDYSYYIKQQINIPFIQASSQEISKATSFSLLRLLDHKVINYKSLMLLLMLPFGGFIVAILRNVIGLKTFGVFLPVLIAFSLLKTGFVTGISIFIFLILAIGLLSQPFSKLGLLHTPKLVISLTLMVIIIIVGSYLSTTTSATWLSSLSFFPIIILTISAERFSTLIVEDGFNKATNMLFQTLIAVSCCYLILVSNWLASALIVFPEILLIIMILSMFLGRYVGLRFSEVIRFNPIFKLKAA
ncbi:7TM domain-containing protein [Pontimicrobium sp. MEBiC01747]